MNLLFDPAKVAFGVFLIEGDKESADKIQKNLVSTARQFGAWQAGAEVGKKAFFMTFTVGYMRVRGNVFFFKFKLI